MKRLVALFMLLAVISSLGCYHAVVTTGSTPNTTIIDKPWAHGFLWGLVPPSVVETASQCPGGVAKFETEQSVPNWLATFITFGIYSPWHIKVTCAAQAVSLGTGDVDYLVPDVDLVIGEGATAEETAEVFQAAADMAMESGDPVYVRIGAQP